MKRLVAPGIYEDLLTSVLEAEIQLRESEGWKIQLDKVDSTIRSEVLARHVYVQLRGALDRIPGKEATKTQKQIELVNRLVSILAEHGAPQDEQVSVDSQLLLSAIDHVALASDSLPRPTLPLRQTSLLVNSRRDAQISSEINREIPSANRIDLLCAFVRYSGLRLFRDELRTRIKAGVPVRVIASVYTGSTERRALDELVELGAQVKVSYDTTRTRLHAKAWLFHRKSGLHTAYIGSSNLTKTAQVDGLEWNVRVSAVENLPVIERFSATFEQYWQEPEFESYDPKKNAEKLDRALSGQKDSDFGFGGLQSFIDVSPKPHQAEALEALESERLRGNCRNLVVAATGTGKTWIAAFDFKRMFTQGLVKSLLFVAHRKEILEQSRQVFQLVLRDAGFGELLVGGQRPVAGHYVFASIQSLANHLDNFQSEDFDIVIVDEFHHAAAKSYEQLLGCLKPIFLLGLTATPERADGQSVLEWFDGRIAYESRLWDALELALLCPFHYFGINDTTDLSGVKFERGRYVLNDLENVLTGDQMRATRICQAVEKYVTQPRKMRALGFCAGIGHAHLMAREFNGFNYSAVALDANTPVNERRQALDDLRKGKLQIIFTVDIFNEGVDIPEVDTVLMLRPTESATIFLQQLGRGLRSCEGKQVLTVLDFVGQVRREYRYDVRYRALLGGTRHQVRQAVEADFPLLPPGCALRLDRIAKQTVLRNLKESVQNARTRMVEDLCILGPDARLHDFMREANLDLEDIYANPGKGHCFFELRRKAGFTDDSSLSDGQASILRTIGRLIYVNDMERLQFWRSILESDSPRPISELEGRAFRLGLMLFAILAGSNQLPITRADEVIKRVRQSSELRSELLDLLNILEDRIRTVPIETNLTNLVPLKSHCTYSLAEIMAAFKRTDRNHALLKPQVGVLRDRPTRTLLLFVTLEKSDKDYSPSTRYADYPISQILFHSESQNSASPDTLIGKSFINHERDNTNVVMFVRQRKSDGKGVTQPYHCLGLVHYVSHQSEKPMKVIWKLEHPMPAWLFEAGKVVAG